MRNLLNNILSVLAVLIFFDLVILMMSLLQLAATGRTGYWSPFWRLQAEFVINLIS